MAVLASILQKLGKLRRQDMRKLRNRQLERGEIRIEDIKLNFKSRDDVPALLIGLQYLYSQKALRDRLFAIMNEYIRPGVSKKVGRPGMAMWNILVMGVVKQGLGCNFDRLHELVNEHKTLRKFLGHVSDDDYQYHYQTLVDNVSLLTPKLLGKVNLLIVQAGHTVEGKKPGAPLRGRCDSFVVEANVHYPVNRHSTVTHYQRPNMTHLQEGGTGEEVSEILFFSAKSKQRPSLIYSMQIIPVCLSIVARRKGVSATRRGGSNWTPIFLLVGHPCKLVHNYPTDVRLLWDAIRCMLRCAGRAASTHDVSGFRQWVHLQESFKKRFNKVRRAKRASPKHIKAYLKACAELIGRVEALLVELVAKGEPPRKIKKIANFLKHAVQQINQIDRRILKGETIPHNEKVFSIFEPHTRWISKGKAGCPVELGVPVCIIECQYRFILHYEIMWEGSDVDFAVPTVVTTKELFPDFCAASFDRGFHSQANRARLDEQLVDNVLPKKGYLSKADQDREQGETFAAMRRQHPAVESAINNLEHRGLDRVRSKGRKVERDLPERLLWPSFP